MADFEMKQLSIPSVCLLISFLAYSSQWLFLHLEPHPLTAVELLKFNSLVLCIWICYFRACTTNPGNVPSGWIPQASSHGVTQEQTSEASRVRSRWCRKCEVLKPPRTHHCKTCGRSVSLMSFRNFADPRERCIPKMDHHCPWTNNCVSHFTFPHFLRFLSYAVASMLYLQYFIYLRGAVIWDNRKMPSVRACP
jgi:palmitoyltransferase